MRGKRADFVETINNKNNPLHSIFGRYALSFFGTSYRRREKYLRLAITISFPTTVRSLSRFRPSDRQNQHRQRYFFSSSQFCRFGYKTLLLIDYLFIYLFIWFSRFRFDSFLLWVIGFSIKRFVFSILDICFCFVFCLFFFRLQKSLKILILVWALLFLILTKSLGLNKYRIECCIDTYFRFFYQNTIEREIRCRNTRRTEKENNRERDSICLNFSQDQNSHKGLLPPNIYRPFGTTTGQFFSLLFSLYIKLEQVLIIWLDCF